MTAGRYQYPITEDLLTMTAIFGIRANEAMKDGYGMVLNHYRTLGYIRQEMANTVTRLSFMLDIAKCKTSGYVGQLCDMGYVESVRGKGSTVDLKVTPLGIEVFEDHRDALQRTFDEILSPLDETQRTLYDMCCSATATLYDGFRFMEKTPDFVYIYLRNSLLTEHSLTKTTKRHGFNLTEFRVLFSLLALREPLMSTELAERLVIPKATLSECLTKLQKKGFVEFARIDGRSKLVKLTMQGTISASLTAFDVDQAYMTGIRTVEPFERDFILTVAKSVADHQRELMK